MNESGCARAAGQSRAKAGRNFFRRITKLEITAIEQLNEGVVNLYAEESVVSDKALRLRIPRLIDMDGLCRHRGLLQGLLCQRQTVRSRYRVLYCH